MQPQRIALLMVLGAAGLPAAPPSSLYSGSSPLYASPAPAQTAPSPLYTQPAQAPATPGAAYAPTPAVQRTPGNAAASVAGAPGNTGYQAPAQAVEQPGAAASNGSTAPPAPAAAQAADGAPAAPAPSSAYPSAPAAAPYAAQTAGGSFQSSPAAPAAQTAPATDGQAVQVPLSSDPWRSSQHLLNEISAHERDGSLAPQKALALRAEVDGIRGGSGLRRPADGAHLGASARRALMRRLKTEDGVINRAASQPAP
ncbi:MAG TPA: hypothetical protein VK842_05330 [bacterium]|nr:hypothetical protein [bacterium]